MLYLILSIACSASLATVLKYGEQRNMSRYVLLSANYLAAVTVGTILVLAKGLPLPDSFDPGPAMVELGRVFAGHAPTLSSGLAWAVLAGLGSGVFYLMALIYYQIGIRHFGMGLAGAFLRLGVLVPMSLSLVLWKEFPALLQWVGIVLALIAIALVSHPSKQDLKRVSRPLLLLICLFGGIAQFCPKLFQKYGLLEYKSLFLLANFGTAFLIGLMVIHGKQERIIPKVVITGMVAGIFNLFTTFSLIEALDVLPAVVVYPAFGAGAVVLVNLVGIFWFKEKLTLTELIAIMLIVPALVLIQF